MKGCKDPLAAARHARGSGAEVKLLEVFLWSDLGSSILQGVFFKEYEIVDVFGRSVLQWSVLRGFPVRVSSNRCPWQRTPAQRELDDHTSH